MQKLHVREELVAGQNLKPLLCASSSSATIRETKAKVDRNRCDGMLAVRPSTRGPPRAPVPDLVLRRIARGLCGAGAESFALAVGLRIGRLGAEPLRVVDGLDLDRGLDELAVACPESLRLAIA